MLNINLIRVILTILAENGETRTITLVKLINTYINSIIIMEPLVFDYIVYEEKITMLVIDVMVDWGDGNITDNMKHNYKTINKKYRVKIYNKPGKTIQIHCASTWPDTITDFISIGRLGITSLNFMFYHNKFNGRIHPNWDTSKINNVGYMFCFAQNFNRKIGDNWDTSQITSMCNMFRGAYKFNQKIGDNWDTSKVTNMSHMFCGARNFNQKIGKNWDISQVINMSDMFSDTNGAFQKNI